MYQPEMNEGVVRSLYRMKRASGKPMTKVLEEVVVTGFAAAEKERVCPLCREEGNDDCANCYLNRRREHEEI